MACGILGAQEAYRQLIITEAALGARPMAYVQITNVGNQTINLSEFELGKVTPWTGRTGFVEGEDLPPIEDWFNVPENEKMRLPNVELAPGESWWVANVSDWRLGMERIDPILWRYREARLDHYDADYPMHYPELPATPPVEDKVDDNYRVVEVWNGRECWYLRHHFINAANEKDSVVIDQVGGVFDEANGTNFDKAYSVAGVPNATNTHKLIRKANVTTGNINFNLSRGVDLADSEWMPVRRKSPRHHSMWHRGNHGNFVLDENTLESNVLTVDWANAKITVPWGVQRDDSLMFQFTKKPGLAWEYKYVNNHADSAYLSARTGDTLRVIALGNTMMVKDFRIEVLPPTAADNIVMPKKATGASSNWTQRWYGSGSAYIDNAYFRTTAGYDMDTIKHSFNIPGITFATRADSLFRYLEKAPKADWEIVWVDGVERLDLKHGDILRVTAENGDVKDYFIKMEAYRPSDNAYLDAITWPDIPADYRGIFGWIGDTIPNFAPSVYSYTIQMPLELEEIPTLVAKPQNSNAKVDVTRAFSLEGSTEQRTITFTVTAESDTTVRVYTVLLLKEKLLANTEPYTAEPFISEFIFWEQWNNGYKEIANPGTLPMDLSNYLFANRYSEGPASIFEWDIAFHNRYQLYIPGYKWTSNLSEWEIEKFVAIQDPNVNPIVAAGDVFVMGETRTWGFTYDLKEWYGIDWWVPSQVDIDFGYETIDEVRIPLNPWGESWTNPSNNNWGESVARQWKGADFYIFKILNDSIKQGLKPATDPADFELIEIFGTGDMNEYDVMGRGWSSDMISSFVRRPEFSYPNPEPKGSFGIVGEPGSGEWNLTDERYWIAQNVGWPQQILYIALGLGNHRFFMHTQFVSQVTSPFYEVSPGYGPDETISPVKVGTTVAEFIARIAKAHPDQSLAMISGTETLDDDAIITDGDALHVTSADLANSSIYTLEVTEDGLSNNAILTSTTYTIDVDGGTGTISGFAAGTPLKTVRNGVVVPEGALLTIVDVDNAYVPLKRANFDSVYVDVHATHYIYFEVFAEDMETRVLYQLVPDSGPGDAFITSDVYEIDQSGFIITLVPGGTSVEALLANLTPSKGATMKVVDRLGHDRAIGTIYKDDKVVVTSEDGTVINSYFITILKQAPNAYLISKVYSVDEVAKRLSVVEVEAITVSDVLAKIEIPEGATIEVTDSDGNVKATTDDIADGDILKVTAYDGVTVAYYTVDLTLTSSGKLLPAAIKMYPNPSSGTVYMEGLVAGSRIQVYNILGSPVLNRIVLDSTEVLSLENQPAGLYFVIISNKKEIIGRHKLIIR
jgi:hypothetical protein